MQSFTISKWWSDRIHDYMNVQGIVKYGYKRTSISCRFTFWKEDTKALNFLYEICLGKEYEEMLKKMDWEHSLRTARHFYYLHLLLKRLKIQKPINVLEIGGGDALLVRMLNYLGLVKRYINIELPEVIDLISYKEKNMMLVPCDSVDNLGTFDLFLNINSFMEMNVETVNDYLSYIASHANDGALLFTANRIKTETKNNPLNYKYPDWNVLYHNIDFLQQKVGFHGKNTAFVRLDQKQ